MPLMTGSANDDGPHMGARLVPPTIGGLNSARTAFDSHY
jgi:hypothetical protein